MRCLECNFRMDWKKRGTYKCMCCGVVYEQQTLEIEVQHGEEVTHKRESRRKGVRKPNERQEGSSFWSYEVSGEERE